MVISIYVIAPMGGVTYKGVMICDTTHNGAGKRLIHLYYFLAVHPGNITYGDSVHAHMLTVSVRTITICDYAHAHFDHHA